MSKIISLDLGTNSVGWAVINYEGEKHEGKILGLGSRIIPSGGKQLDYYKRGMSLTNSKGQTVSKCAERRGWRSQRRNGQRYKDRRNKLLLALDALGWKPVGIDYKIDFSRKYPQPIVLPKKAKLAKTKNYGYQVEKTEVFQQYEKRYRAIHGILSLPELGSVLYHLNQRRGYQDIGLLNQVEDIEETTIRLKPNQRKTKGEIIDCKPTGRWKAKRMEYEYTIQENDQILNGFTTIPYFENYKGKSFEVLIERDKEGTEFLSLYKPGSATRSRRENNESLHGKTIGEKLFSELNTLQNSSNVENLKHWDIKLRKRIFDRKHYKNEFDRIWEAQSIHYDVLNNTPKNILQNIAKILIPKNEIKQKELIDKGLKFILKNHIIYYQRELKKGQKNQVVNCNFELPIVCEHNGLKIKRYFKCIPISHPFYQEFRIWQTINNLKIKDYKGDEILIDDDGYRQLYNLFFEKDEITPDDILKKLKLNIENYFTNYRKEAKLKGNITLVKIGKILGKQKMEEIINKPETLELLWHIIYSIPQKDAKIRTLTKARFKNNKTMFEFTNETVNQLSKISLEKKYGSLSRKAILKILPLMRRLEWFSFKDIDILTKEKIDSILANGDTTDLSDNFAQKISEFNNQDDFQGLRTDEALALVYGQHTKAKIMAEYNRPEDIKLLKQHGLRHPIVEEIVNETLKIVKNIWQQFGPDKPNAIHIELAREMQNSQMERETIYKNQISSRERNNEIKKILISVDFNIPNPTMRQVERYRLWQEQKFHCIYTGEYISPEDLFATGNDGVSFYDIDHIIPKRRLFDDSFSNKVLCKRSVNEHKGKLLAREFMETKRDFEGLLSFSDFCEKIKEFPKAKRQKLLMKNEDLPSDFIERQKKETQYITKRVIAELSKIVGSENVHTTTGGVTAVLRHEWGINDIFMRALKERYWNIEKKIQNMGIDFKLIEENGTNLRIADFTKRIDHRHHALDALVIACTSPKHIKYLNDLNKIHQNSTDDYYKSLKDFATEIIRDGEKNKLRFRKPWEGFCEEVQEWLPKIGISYKQKSFYAEFREHKYKAGYDENNKITLKTQQNKPLSIKGELHNSQPDSWRYVPGKNITIKKMLSELEKIQPDKRNEFLKRILPKSILLQVLSILDTVNWDIKKALKALENQIKNKHDEILETLPTFETRIVKRKTISELEIKDIENIRDAEIRKEIENHINELFNGDIEQAFNAEGLFLFNKNMTLKGKHKVLKVQLLQKGLFDPLSPKSVNKIIIRKNSFNERAVFTTSDKAWNIIYENINDSEDRDFKPISLFDYTQCLISDIDFVEKKEGYKYCLFNNGSLMYMPDEGENINNIDFTRKENIFNKIYRFSRLSGSQWYYLPHFSSEPLEFEIEKDGKNILIREFGASTEDFECVPGTSKKIKQHGIPIEVDRLGNIKIKKWFFFI